MIFFFGDFEMFLSISVYWRIQLFCRFQIDPLLLIHQSIQYDLFHVAFHSASAQSKLSFYHQGSTDRQPVRSCPNYEPVRGPAWTVQTWTRYGLRFLEFSLGRDRNRFWSVNPCLSFIKDVFIPNPFWIPSIHSPIIMTQNPIVRRGITPSNIIRSSILSLVPSYSSCSFLIIKWPWPCRLPFL